MPKITKATAKAAVRLHAAKIAPEHIEIDSDSVTIWIADPADDTSRDEAEAAAFAIAVHCNATTTGNGSKWIVWFKRPPVTAGHDWNDKASPHHW